MPANSNVMAVGVSNGTAAPVVVSVANTLRDGTGTLTALATAGTQGALFARVRATHHGVIGTPSTAMVVRLWVTSGAVKVMLDEQTLPSVTPTASVPGATVTFVKTNISLKSGEVLSVTTSVSEAVGFVADQGGDF